MSKVQNSLKALLEVLIRSACLGTLKYYLFLLGTFALLRRRKNIQRDRRLKLLWDFLLVISFLPSPTPHCSNSRRVGVVFA